MNLLDAIFADIALMARPALFNIYFAFAAIPLGFLFAVLLALGKASHNRLTSAFSRGYIYAFRGSPFFIQLFMIYSLVLSLNIPLWRPWGISWLMLSPLFLGPAILMLNTAAYTAEILYGALRTIPKGEVEAGRAFGMSRLQQFRFVTWPHMIRIAWPAYTNEVVFLFHATALVYFTLPVIDNQQDLMNKARELFERDYNVFLHFSVAAGYFLAISLVIFFIFRRIYRRLMAHLPAEPDRRIRYAPRWL
ncbi:polar amino acid transport system permease protein [Devosia enhydra]|uniref:Polar amino acid transport system permease protein n=1 Tax=Devosia enhydra TaxID=665118 RepID=A0A1K2HXZ3_9HYPH|nr:ABC transporter permease subunit [Devosia enhydra]SFZ83272.1 polar amino acid transport system permease protein [Devosia enhydra]